MYTRQKLISLSVCYLLACACFGQTKFEPQILVLSPYEVKYDRVFKEEISKIDKEIKEKASQLGHDDVSMDSIGNMKKMVEEDSKYAQSLGFNNEISYFSQSYLIYGFYERFPKVLIGIKDIKSKGNASELKKISEEEDMQYVLNFPVLNFFKKSGASFSNIRVQLYDRKSNTLLIDSVFIGNWSNPGFEFSCQDSSLNCTINNVLSQVMPEVIHIVAENSPLIKQQNELASERYLELMEDYYPRSYDKEFLSKIIQPTDGNINTGTIYQCITDSSKTKFVAFFLEQFSADNYQEFKNSKKDNNVTIISNMNIKDSGFLNDIPKTYAYIVKGLKFKGKWYYKKDNVTYFNSNSSEEGRKEYFNNLQGWDYFKDNSTQLNPFFWEGNLFPKVVDRTKDPDWAKYGSTILKHEEEENLDYIGLYEIVADELKKQKEEEIKTFTNTVSESFKSFYENLEKQDPGNFGSYNLLDDKFELIYPKSLDYILNMIEIINSKGEKAIRYFLLFRKSGQILEWTYFTEHPIDANNIKDPDRTWYGTLGMAQLDTLTDWDYSYKTLDNQDFWDKYVLIKSGDKYEYLKPVK